MSLAPLTAAAPRDNAPTSTVSALAQAPRLLCASAAVASWNRPLAGLGIPCHLGAVSLLTDPVPTEDLERLSTAVLTREPHPEVLNRVRQMAGDSLLATSAGECIAFAMRVHGGEQDTWQLGTWSHWCPSVIRPNAASHVMAHAWEHGLGWGHHPDGHETASAPVASCQRPVRRRAAGVPPGAPPPLERWLTSVEL